MRRLAVSVLITVPLLVAACGGGSSTSDGGASSAPASGASASAQGSSTPTSGGEPVTLTMVTYDSFAASKDVLQAFTDETGIRLKLLPIGDTGETLSRVILTKDRPLGDVLWGVDTTYLSRAQGAGITVPYASPALADVDPALVATVPAHDLTPVDDGDVCVNVDHGWYARKGIPEPRTLDDLADPRYRGQLVVEDPTVSAPGLAFLLATVARYGEDGFAGYWERLRKNDVQVVSGWTEAYTAQFSGSSGKGPRPLVVSYGTSPPAEMLEATPPLPAQGPTGVLEDTCFRTTEYAAILKGTAHEAEARKLIDFLLSERFQADMPMQIFVLPVRTGTPLPDVFRRYAVIPQHPATLPPDRIEARRDAWIDAWKRVAVG